MTTADVAFEEFGRDRFRQHGVERCIEIISEASRHIPEAIKVRHPEIPWRRVSDIGNRLRHVYHDLDSALIWEVVTGELSDLRRVVEALLDEAP